MSYPNYSLCLLQTATFLNCHHAWQRETRHFQRAGPRPLAFLGRVRGHEETGHAEALRCQKVLLGNN